MSFRTTTTEIASNPAALLRAIADGNFFRPSLPCVRLFRVEARFFNDLRAECVALVTEHASKPFTLDENKNHPYGEACQLSLLNRSGRLDDTSDCHDHAAAGKRFHHGVRYPQLARFVAAFPHAYNMRINVMGAESGLSPHKEATLHRKPHGGYYLRARFHLPIQTNPHADLLVGGALYHFAEREVYFFHNGMVHSAANRGATARYHLVWDMLVTRATFDLMFAAAGGAPAFLERIAPADWEVSPRAPYAQRSYDIVDWLGGERLYRALRLSHLGVQPHHFCELYLRAAGLRRRRLELAEMDASP
jgi:hypothetical protein